MEINFVFHEILEIQQSAVILLLIASDQSRQVYHPHGILYEIKAKLTDATQ